MSLSIASSRLCPSCLRRLGSQSLRLRKLSTTPRRQKHGIQSLLVALFALLRTPTGALPSFQTTSSPELDSILSTFRTNVFLPAHLIRPQTSLIYRPKNHPLLTNPDEPATVRLGDEVLQLHPLNHLYDEPATRPSFAKVLDLMNETRDWRNLPGFLEGLKTAGRKLGRGQVEKMVRKANECGRQGVVMEIMRRVEATGVGLWDVDVARECMLGATMRAQQGEWESEGIEAGVKLARQYWDLLWDDRHRVIRPVGLDPRRRPEIVGIVVELLAAKALKSGERRDEVERFVERLLGLWKWAELRFDAGNQNDANKLLLMWAPAWHGMVLARQVLGKDSRLGKVLGERLHSDLESILVEARDLLAVNMPDSGGKRGLRMYEQLMHSEFS